MESRDRQPPFANGVDCAVCGQLVPAERIRVLARRDDLTFAELDCASCRSESLGILIEGDARGDTSGSRYGEFLAADDARFRDALPIGADDVLDIRGFLAAGGDLAALVGRTGSAPRATSDRAARRREQR
jgi:hypothetical protein